MKVILTGGAGFIGSHIADLLVAHGHQVTVIDNLSSGRLSNLPDGVTFHRLDVRDTAVLDLWAEEKFDAMIHMAAQMNLRRSVEDPGFDADVNIRGLLNLMEAGRKHGLERVVFASSGGAAYDDNVPRPTRESEPANPLSPYGVAKIASEYYLNYYRGVYGIHFTALRIANAYGPRQNPHGEAGVVSIFAQRLLNGKVPVINGTGKQTRDYVYVGDLARLSLRALEATDDETYHAGTGVETSVLELFAHIREAVGSDIEAEFAPAKAGEVMHSALDSGKAAERLGWQPEVSVSEGIRRTVAFFREQRDRPDVR